MRDIKLNEIEDVLNGMKKHFVNKDLACESVNLDDALNRQLAENIVSDLVIPAYRKSTVDGYAMKLTQEPIDKRLVLENEILNVEEILCEDHCIYVPTGGRVPEDADVMVKIEETTRQDNIISFKAYTKKENIIEVGADMQEGDILYVSGHKITSFDIGVLGLLGYSSVNVKKKPTLAIISTGDELVPVGSDIKLGQTRDINSHTIGCLAKAMGLDVVYTDLVNDTKEKLKASILKGHELSDITVISGGSSMGVKDYTFDILNEIGHVLSDGMALKPGKPTIVSESNGKPVLGLPGHPVSAIMVFKILMKDLLNVYGINVKDDSIMEATVTRDVRPAKGRDTYQMLHFTEEEGQVYAHPTSGKSGMMTLLTKSQGYTIIDKSDQLKSGQKIRCYLF